MVAGYQPEDKARDHDPVCYAAPIESAIKNLTPYDRPVSRKGKGGNMEYYRKGRQVFARTPDGATRRIVTTTTRVAAALTVQRLYATDGGKKGDWRIFLNKH
jgi:hypothetical protein